MLKGIDDRHAIEKQCAENIPNIFDIPEINLKHGKNKPDPDNENQKNRHRHHKQQSVEIDCQPRAAEQPRGFKEYPNADIAQNRNRKCYKV